MMREQLTADGKYVIELDLDDVKEIAEFSTVPGWLQEECEGVFENYEDDKENGQ